MNLFSLEGRVALVTGAGRGIGRGIAEGLAAHGARVVCAARTRHQLEETVRAIQAAGGDAWALEMDVTLLESIEGGVERALTHYGQIDILVNNAGMAFRASALEVKEENYERIMAVNLKGPFFLTREVARHMIPRKYGKVIHIGSVVSSLAFTMHSVYVASKGAVGALTRAQAMEFAVHGIRVNAICPGFVFTKMTEASWTKPENQAWAKEQVPLGRLGGVEDFIGAAVFLSSAASDYVTGQSIYVDGGFGAGFYRPGEKRSLLQ